MAVLIYSEKKNNLRIQTVFRDGIIVDTENPRASTTTTVEVLSGCSKGAIYHVNLPKLI